MEEVLPLLASWEKLKTLSLADPLPSSIIPLLSTPTRVDFPLSTLPITATLISNSSLTLIDDSNLSKPPSNSFRSFSSSCLVKGSVSFYSSGSESESFETLSLYLEVTLPLVSI